MRNGLYYLGFGAPRLCLVALSALLLGGMPSPTLASQASPAPVAIACDVEPRTVAEIVALAESTPTGGRPRDVLPPSQPADPVTAAEIAATVRRIEACLNTRDELRFLALFSDDLFRQMSIDAEAIAELEADAMPASPAPEGERSVIIGPWNVRLLDDGRVLAALLLTTEADPEPDPIHTKAVVFVREGGRWLIGSPMEESVGVAECDGRVAAVSVLGPPPSEAAVTAVAIATPSDWPVSCREP